MTIKPELHSGLLKKYSDHPSVIPLIEEWPNVESAITRVLEDGNYKAYVDAIEKYDRHIWTESKKPDGSNPIAYKKWKIYPTWSELNWAIVYQRLSDRLPFQTTLIRANQVVEGITSQNDIFFKDVDGGIALAYQLNDRDVLMPVVVMEHKGGHFCKTACTGVNAIARRFHDMNPDIVTVQITENNVSIGKEQTDGLIKDIDYFIIDRGKNRHNHTRYWPRNHDVMQKHEDELYELLKDVDPNRFTSVKIENVSNKSLREQLDETNYIKKEKMFG